MIRLNRDIHDSLLRFTKFPVVGLFGPRQSGKTTLARATFPNHVYISLEDLDHRTFAATDPRGFLDTYAQEKGIIYDWAKEAHFQAGHHGRIHNPVSRRTSVQDAGTHGPGEPKRRAATKP